VQGHARLLRNLLENARRHGKPQGAQASGAAVAVKVRLLLTRGGSRQAPIAVVTVEDRGPSVPADLRESIFEPFYRLPGASEREGGVGLGLALVRTIAKRYGGSARCEAREGGGARFVVAL
jgi:signal transduction histidine kinase